MSNLSMFRIPTSSPWLMLEGSRVCNATVYPSEDSRPEYNEHHDEDEVGVEEEVVEGSEMSVRGCGGAGVRARG